MILSKRDFLYLIFTPLLDYFRRCRVYLKLSQLRLLQEQNNKKMESL